MGVAASELTPEPCSFLSGETACAGWFYPPSAAPPHACVVLAHGFGADPSGPVGLFSARFAQAGVAAFAFDYRGFGASDGEPRQLLDVARQLEDWHSAISYVRERADIDPGRVGLWGSSLSGGEVLAVAANDPEVAAVVAQVPYADGFSVARAAGIRHNLRLMPAVLRDLLRAKAGRAPYLIEALGAPGGFATVSTRFPDLYPALVKAAPKWRNRVAARSILQLYRFRPLRVADRIRCPLLVVLSYQDRVAPPAPTVRAAQGLPYVELALLQARHFDLYAGRARDRALHTEVQFFRRHLGDGRQTATSGPSGIRIS